jgi:hypothetical protein
MNETFSAKLDRRDRSLLAAPAFTCDRRITNKAGCAIQSHSQLRPMDVQPACNLRPGRNRQYAIDRPARHAVHHRTKHHVWDEHSGFVALFGRGRFHAACGRNVKCDPGG